MIGLFISVWGQTVFYHLHHFSIHSTFIKTRTTYRVGIVITWPGTTWRSWLRWSTRFRAGLFFLHWY